MLKYYLYTQRPGADVWTWAAISYLPETVYNEENLAYMSVNDIRYRVEVIGDEETVLEQRTYEPSERLKKKYKDYFLRVGDQNGQTTKDAVTTTRSPDSSDTTKQKTRRRSNQDKNR